MESTYLIGSSWRSVSSIAAKLAGFCVTIPAAYTDVRSLLDFIQSYYLLGMLYLAKIGEANKLCSVLTENCRVSLLRVICFDVIRLFWFGGGIHPCNVQVKKQYFV